MAQRMQYIVARGLLIMLRLMIKMGIHGKRHKIAEAKLIKYMHENGMGA